MQPFIVPSIFTATDQYSSTLDKMANTTQRFNNKVESLHAKSTKAFNALTPSISEAGKQLLSYAGTAAVAAGIISTARFSVDSLMKYEDELANLQAVTGTSGLAFEKFKVNINEVARETNKSAVDVAAAFTAISNNQPELLKDADALAAVTKSSILLAKAAKMELQPAGEAITQILNQFGKGAKDAAKTVDILAAGSVAGSSEIRDTADAIQAFGTVAANMGIKINESVALIELGSKFEKGTEAGMKFRNILLEIGKGKAQDPKALADWKKWGVSIEVLTNKSLPLSTRLKEISKIRKDDVAIMHTFGKENAAMATGIMSTIDKFDGMVKSVDTTGMASEMASKNMDTLRNRTEEAKNAFVNMLTGSDNLNSGLKLAKDTMKFFGEHMGFIVGTGVKVVAALMAWKAVNLLLKASILATRAISTAFYIVDMVKYVASTQGISFATAAWTIAQNSLNVAMLANPIGVFILAIVALGLAIYGIHAALDALAEPLNAAFNREQAVKQEAFAIMDLREQYLALGKTLKESEALAIGKATVGLQSEIIAAKMQLASPMEEERDKGVEAMNLIQGKAQQLANFQKDPSAAFKQDLGQKFANTKELGTLVGSIGQENAQMQPSTYDWVKEAINPKLAQQTAMTNSMTTNTNTNNSKAEITIHNDSNSAVSLDGGGKSTAVLPNTSSTTMMSAH